MFDRIRKVATSAALRALTPNSVPIAYSQATSRIVLKDEAGTVRTLVQASDTDPFSAIDGATRFIEVSISSAELLALRATPKTIVAAPGAGKMLVFHDMLVLADNILAYTVGANDFALRYKDTAGDIISQTIDSAGLLDQVVDISTQVEPIATDSKSPKADVENQPLVMHNTGAAEWTVGTGALRVKIWYSVITTGW